MMGLKVGAVTGPVGIGGWEATAAVAIFCLWTLKSELWFVAAAAIWLAMFEGVRRQQVLSKIIDEAKRLIARTGQIVSCLNAESNDRCSKYRFMRKQSSVSCEEYGIAGAGNLVKAG